jgi:YrbI family 3-deoxy-D-manno-octulosonate 8-phosphate phosphatase
MANSKVTITPNNAIAVIPARGGSKGIPRKNILPIAGKPLIAWTIHTAKQSRYISDIYVSTDDLEIAYISQKNGANVVMRPHDISGDFAPSELAILHVLQTAFPLGRQKPDITVFLQCTSPLTTTDDIDLTVESLIRTNSDSALTVSEFHYFLWHQDKHGDFVGINHDKRVRHMRQQRDLQYRETGAVYAMRTNGFIEEQHRFFGKTTFHVVPDTRTLEIDTPEDFAQAEHLLQRKLWQDKQSNTSLPRQIDLLVFDFDGVMTDNNVLISSDGMEYVNCNRSDGMGVEILRQLGIPMLILSKETNPVVTARANKLQIECIQSIDDKRTALLNYLKKKQLNPQNVIYVGNDINDKECLDLVGFPIIVADSHPSVVNSATIRLQSGGGRGAVREIADIILRNNK